jgi:D-aminopeptidase
MICHEFKGGIGTASRRLPDDLGGWTVGVLVQANYGRRGLLRIDGVPIGEAISTSEVPSPHSRVRRGIGPVEAGPPAGSGSIIGIVATDAPLLPGQCRRLAHRAALGLARTGGLGATTSGDIFLCFATGNHDLPAPDDPSTGFEPIHVRAVPDLALDPLFEATVEATEEAIVNALVAADTMTGRDGITAYRLPHERLVAVMRSAGRLRGSA